MHGAYEMLNVRNSNEIFREKKLFCFLRIRLSEDISREKVGERPNPVRIKQKRQHNKSKEISCN